MRSQPTPGSYDWSFIPGTKTVAPDLAPFDPRIWENHNSVLIGTFTLAVLYLWAVGPLRKRKGWAPKFPVGRAVTFFVGLLVLLLSLNADHAVHDNGGVQESGSALPCRPGPHRAGHCMLPGGQWPGER